MDKTNMYHTNIEAVLIEYISDAKESITIIMAWFTSKTIKEALIRLKGKKPKVNIEIVVDTNEINDKYFLNDKNKFEDIGIKIYKKVNNTFLHDKILVIDSKITITGSYNYSNKAKSNLENIAVIFDETISLTNLRLFKFLTIDNYIDENIVLLFKYPDFAQSIIWSYYAFSAKEYKKYKNRIIIGDCFTHENGIYEEIKYDPGFIFNFKVKLEKNIKPFEFPLPINKALIKNWTGNRNEEFILDSYNGKENEYVFINDDLERSEAAVERFFKIKIESTYQPERLEATIINGIDIIIENHLWFCNFLLFLNEDIIEKLFENFPITDEPIIYPPKIFN